MFFFWMIAAHGLCVLRREVIEKDSPDEVDWIKFRTDGHPLPVYGPDGVKRGEILPGEGIPEEWPKGLYIIPYGKMMKK